MPTWSEILVEIQQGLKANPSVAVLDQVRRKYLKQLSDYTKRNTILYATKWTIADTPPSEALLVNEEDIQAFMEVVHGLQTGELDLILHSPGGTAEAAEALVKYLRTKFYSVRAIIPQGAFSAATMWACSANRIIMGKHSYIGPIDPQIPIAGPLAYAPAQTILDQFEMAKKECADPAKLPPWLPILEQYGPALLVQCQEQIRLSRELVATWLREYMFGGMRNKQARARRARRVAKNLAKHAAFKSHGRHIDRYEAAKAGLIIDDLESDQVLQDLVLSVFHATTHTFTMSPTVKIVENQNGKAFMKAQFTGQLMQPGKPAVAPA